MLGEACYQPYFMWREIQREGWNSTLFYLVGNTSVTEALKHSPSSAYLYKEFNKWHLIWS